MDKEGAYIEDEAKIIINKLVTSEERRHFTLFHELVHYLIRQDEDFYGYLHEVYQDNNEFDKTIELICNIGAAEIILPTEQVRDVIEKQGFSLELLIKFCQATQVSGPAALIQLVQCAPNQCYGVICEYGNSSITSHPGQIMFVSPVETDYLYIQYAIWSPSAKYPIARFTRVSSNHILSSALSNHSFLKGIDTIPFRSGKDWRVPCEVQYFRQNVYGLFHATPPPNPEQPRLL